MSRPDIICLQGNPLNADSIKCHTAVRHRSFDDVSQKREFLKSNFPTDLGSEVCCFVLKARPLLTRRMRGSAARVVQRLR